LQEGAPAPHQPACRPTEQGEVDREQAQGDPGERPDRLRGREPGEDDQAHQHHREHGNPAQLQQAPAIGAHGVEHPRRHQYRIGVVEVLGGLGFLLDRLHSSLRKQELKDSSLPYIKVY